MTSRGPFRPKTFYDSMECGGGACLGDALGCSPVSRTGMAEVGRDLWRSSGPIPCSSRATQSQLARAVGRQILSI